jgi:hypothetical protein
LPVKLLDISNSLITKKERSPFWVVALANISPYNARRQRTAAIERIQETVWFHEQIIDEHLFSFFGKFRMKSNKEYRFEMFLLQPALVWEFSSRVQKRTRFTLV